MTAGYGFVPVLPSRRPKAGAAAPISSAPKCEAMPEQFEGRRESASKRGYGAAWRRLRLAHLAREPCCVMCARLGRVNDGRFRADGAEEPNPRRRSPHVDHKIPHRGDRALLLDPANLQTLCPDHHDMVKRREELQGFSSSVDADGWPTDPRHPANRP